MAGLVGGLVLQGSPIRRTDVLIRILLDPLVLALVFGGLLALFLFSAGCSRASGGSSCSRSSSSGCSIPTSS